MSFPLVHFNCKLVLTAKNGTVFTLYSRYAPPYNAAIDFTYNFQKSSDPSENQVTIHGLTRKHAKMFTKGSTVAIYAGWCNSDCSQNNYHLIFKEKITQSATMINEGGDWQTSFTCMDGKSFAKEQSLAKDKSKSIRSGASNESELSSAERKALNKIKKQFGIKTNDINKIKDQIRKHRSKLGPLERAEKAKVKADYPDRHGGGRKSGDTAYNKSQAQHRKRLNHEITKKYQDIRASLKNADDSLIKRRKINTKRKTKATRRIRTQYQAKRKRNRAKRTRDKSKSVKHKNGLHFKKGTRASAIIKNLAKRAGIHISKLDLVKNKRYTHGYTADKQPKQCIKDIIKDCKSSIWWPNGKLVIGNFTKHKQTPFTLTPETGLIETPQNQDEDDDSSSDNNNNVIQYTVNAIFLPFVTVGSKFRIIDPINSLPNQPGKETVKTGSLFDDTVVVLSGVSTVDSGSTPSTNLTVVKASQQAKANAIDAKNKVKKIKNRKDARERHKTRVKRHARQHIRKRA